MSHIALVLMVKNEEKRIHVSLESVIDIVKSIIVYDTGSTDSTISIIKSFCKQHQIPLRLKHGEFVDFSTSRNILLDFADTFQDVDYLLLLDSNDELKEGQSLLHLCDDTLKTSSGTAWFIRQEWFAGDSTTSYYNVRLIKPRCHWRFQGVVHEYLINTKNDIILDTCPRINDHIHIYQDRVADGDKSCARFPEDAKLLLNECNKNPDDARSHFYLAQTYDCMNNWYGAYKYYYLRTKLKGYDDEIFHSWYRMGLIVERLLTTQTIFDYPELDIGKVQFVWNLASSHYIKALESSVRVEPLLRLGNHYIETKNWEMSYHFLRWACILEYPSTTALFVDKYMYEYTRYHALAISAFYCKKFKEGIVACRIAIEKGNKEIDKHNLKFYEEELLKINI